MTDLPRNLHEGNAGAQPGDEPASLALSLTQQAVARLAKQLKIDLSDKNLLNIVIARAQNTLKAAGNQVSAHPARHMEPAKNPGIIPLYVQQALNTYREIDTLPSEPE
ncbi:MAG: hypothetical protein Q7V20_16215 [Aquabacterium sp.]|uniref:hypothetical protein n=1 Tax=Aquabacterium sp. TaxID=1872578 RepID=UPI00272671AA|nr:hypothetical protein [Aquabacterium sp.]MDO9004990.1 hypothetical protein [Aquabacterium sp.]